MTGGRTGDGRDPEGRRRAIVQAAVQVIAEVGVGNVTHRLIAARAGVPLGSTTYYFPTLDDLITAALAEVANAASAATEVWRHELSASQDRPETLVSLMERYVEHRSRAILEYELYLAAAHTPALQPLARAWIDDLRVLFTALTGPETAAALAALVDGAMLQALVTGDPLDRAALRAGIARLLR